MSHSEAVNALGSAGNKSFSSQPKSEKTGSVVRNNRVPIASAKYAGQSSFHSDDDCMNSDEEGEIVRKDLRQESTIFENGTEMTSIKSSCHPGATVNYSLESNNGRRTLLGESSSRHSSASPTPSAPLSPTGASSTHSEESYAIPTITSGLGSATSPTNTSVGTSLITPQHSLYSQYAPTNRNYSFLASQTQVDNITRHNQAIISNTENEKLRKLKQKKENKDKKKDKNVNVYTTGPQNDTNGNGTEFSIDKVLESLGEIKNEKQSKKSQKTKSNYLKQTNNTTAEKSKGQRKSYEKASAPSSIEDLKLEENNENGKGTTTDTDANKLLSEQQRKNKKVVETNAKVSDPYFDNPQVKELMNFSRNFVLVDLDSNAPGDLKRQTSKSTENLFTTVLPKKQKNKKKFPATDADIYSSPHNDAFRSKGPVKGTGQPNSSHSNRDRAAVGNNGAKISAALSDTSHSHQEVMRSSSSSAALVNANNTENSSKYNYYQMHQNIQKSTGTSSITSDSVTGESLSESASLATDLDLATDFPPLGLNEVSTINSGNGHNDGTVDDQQTLNGNRAPLPKAVWPIVRPNLSSSDSTAVIENNVKNTNVNENVNNASENHNSNNAVASPDVSISSISTSSFTTASSNITTNNLPSSQMDASNIQVDMSKSTASVAQNNNAPSYSSALLGCNGSNKANNAVQQSANLPITEVQQQNARLIKSSPPDITSQATNALVTKAFLPDVTAQASTTTDGYQNSNSHPTDDSGSSTPQPQIAAEICKDDSGYQEFALMPNEYDNRTGGLPMQEVVAFNPNDSISSATGTQSGSQNTCYFIDDTRAVAIALNEKAYNNNHSGNGNDNVMSMSTSDIDNDTSANVPAVTILGRGETPVADWSSKCDGLEFGGPINEDLLSMEYLKPYDIDHHSYNSGIQPRDSYYQEVMVAKANNSNIGMEQSYEGKVNERIVYETQQCIVSPDITQSNIPLPDMDRAIISFGECPNQEISLVPDANASQINPHVFDADNNELNNGQNANDKRNSDYGKYSNTCDMTGGLEYNSNIRYTGEGFNQDNAGNIMTAQSVTSASTNSSEENYPQSVPLNNELNDFSATNWASQIENGESVDDEKHPESFLEANILYSAAAINEANKVNYNYQEILSFVSNSWEKVEKELMSGAEGKYYYSRSVPNNKNNSSIAKLNNVQKH